MTSTQTYLTIVSAWLALKELSPVVKLMETIYQKGVRMSKKAHELLLTG